MSADQGPIIIGLNAALMALTLAAISSRVGRRIFIVGTWSHHDVLILVAAISAFLFSICLCIGTNWGLGVHAAQWKENDHPKLLKLVMISNVFYFGCNWAVKHALLVFYSEIVREKKYQSSIWFMHFIAFGFGLSSILVNLFQCRPFSKAFYPEKPGWCAKMGLFYYFNAPIMIATDVVLYVMPVVFTWNLQLRKPQRIGLNCLFGLGCLVLIASAFRMYAVDQFNKKGDFTWWFANAMIWSCVENHLAIFVACAPSIKVIALLLFPRLMSSYRKMMSRVTPSYRSRSRTPFDSHDLESGTRKSSKSAQSDKLKPTPSSTPLPSPALTQGSRGSKGFGRLFSGPKSPKSPKSPRHFGSKDSMDDTLVHGDDTNASRGSEAKDIHMVTIERDAEFDKKWNDERISGKGLTSQPRDSDIRVERTIQIESARESSDDDISALPKSPRA